MSAAVCRARYAPAGVDVWAPTLALRDWKWVPTPACAIGRSLGWVVRGLSQ